MRKYKNIVIKSEPEYIDVINYIPKEEKVIKELIIEEKSYKEVVEEKEVEVVKERVRYFRKEIKVPIEKEIIIYEPIEEIILKE